MSKRKLHERMALFNAGDWAQLLLESNNIAEAGTQAAVRKRRQHVQDDISRRAARAERLALLGELSAGRQALEGATIAPGNLSTLRDLTNPIRRPAAPREPLHEDLTRYVPEHDFQLDPDVFLANIRSARRGAAGQFGQRRGSSGRLGGNPHGTDDSSEEGRRTIAQQIAKSVEAATSPFQYALSTKAGTECVSHILQTLRTRS